MHPNLELIERFYAAFGRRDGETMASCYTPDAVFSDPAFGELRGPDIGDMWRMLTAGADDLDIELAEHDAGDEEGAAHWIARYTFSRTGRHVVNDIDARFRFADGRFAEHRDHFSFHRWSRQAMGPVGLVLGWTPVLRGAFQRRARASLREFAAASGRP